MSDYEGIQWNGEPLTDQNLDIYYEGVMVTVDEIHYKSSKPGWKCNSCGQVYVTQGLPPSHECPVSGKAK